MGSAWGWHATFEDAQLILPFADCPRASGDESEVESLADGDICGIIEAGPAAHSTPVLDEAVPDVELFGYRRSTHRKSPLIWLQ